jgi:hypothetical protein
MKSYTKDPEATRTYEIDWSDYLQGLGNVTIQTSAWTVPDGLIIEDETNTATTTAIKLSGGSVNVNYTLYNKITTSGGDADRRAFLVRIRDAATFNEAGDAEEALAAVRALLKGKATQDQKEYTINNRQLVRYDMSELLALESRLVSLVNQGRMTAALRNGSPLLKNVQSRFRG